MQNKRNTATFHHQGGNIERKERGIEKEGEYYVNSETNIRIWGLGGVELLYRQTFYYISWKSKKWKRGFPL